MLCRQDFLSPSKGVGFLTNKIIHLARLQAICLWVNHGGSDESAPSCTEGTNASYLSMIVSDCLTIAVLRISYQKYCVSLMKEKQGTTL